MVDGARHWRHCSCSVDASAGAMTAATMTTRLPVTHGECPDEASCDARAARQRDGEDPGVERPVRHDYRRHDQDQRSPLHHPETSVSFMIKLTVSF